MMAFSLSISELGVLHLLLNLSMKLTIYQVDAFAEKVFQGNPAAVCPLKEWLNDELLLKIAAENNLSETAFYVISEDRIEIRWFTPNTEVDLCGHATLATAFILHKEENFNNTLIPFHSNRSGHLPVNINNDNSYTLDFPLDHISEISISETLFNATSLKPIHAYKGKSDIMLIFEKQEDIEQLIPNLSVIEKLDARGLIVTAIGNNCDFVSRFFGPQVGVDEDPVTGSAHTTLTNYWGIVLNKNEFTAEQISTRKGKLKCKKVNNRVEITGKAILYMKGEITI
jgi:PhzF family phenazine biosynthesis protein